MDVQDDVASSGSSQRTPGGRSKRSLIRAACQRCQRRKTKVNLVLLLSTLANGLQCGRSAMGLGLALSVAAPMPNANMRQGKTKLEARRLKGSMMSSASLTKSCNSYPSSCLHETNCKHSRYYAECALASQYALSWGSSDLEV